MDGRVTPHGYRGVKPHPPIDSARQGEGHRDVVTVVGHAATISAGEWITASGEWINDRTHCQQFQGAVPAHVAADFGRWHRKNTSRPTLVK
jgi:hypothetical protein